MKFFHTAEGAELGRLPDTRPGGVPTRGWWWSCADGSIGRKGPRADLDGRASVGTEEVELKEPVGSTKSKKNNGTAFFVESGQYSGTCENCWQDFMPQVY